MKLLGVTLDVSIREFLVLVHPIARVILLFTPAITSRKCAWLPLLSWGLDWYGEGPGTNCLHDKIMRFGHGAKGLPWVLVVHAPRLMDGSYDVVNTCGCSSLVACTSGHLPMATGYDGHALVTADGLEEIRRERSYVVGANGSALACLPDREVPVVVRW